MPQDAENPELGGASLIIYKGWSKLKSLDGNCRLYTVSVLCTLGLGIATAYFDADFLDRDNEVLLDHITNFGDTMNAAWLQIIRALLLLALCILIAVTAFFMVAINVCTFTRDQTRLHRFRLITSFIAFILTNVLVILVLVSSQQKFNQTRDDSSNYSQGIPHFLLFITLILSTLIMDYLFVAVVFVECLAELRQNEAETGWSRVKKRLRSIARMQNADLQPNEVPQQQPSIAKIVRGCGHAIIDGILKAVLIVITALINIARWILRIKDEEEKSTKTENMKYFSQDLSEFFLDVTFCVSNSCLFNTIHSICSFITWDVWSPFRRTLEKSKKMADDENWMNRVASSVATAIHDTIDYWVTFSQRCRNFIDTMYDDVREDSQFKHSSWVLAATLTSTILLLYFGVAATTQVSGFIREIYIPRRDCAVSTVNNNGELGNFILRMAGFAEDKAGDRDESNLASQEALTQAACSADLNSAAIDQINELSANFTALTDSGVSESDLTLVDGETAVQNFIESNSTGSRAGPDASRMYQCSINEYSSDSCLPLLIINQISVATSESLNETQSPTNVFNDSALGKTIYLFDKIISHLRWSVWIGLAFGLTVGIYSLLSVLGQYKRFSLAIRCGFFEDLPIAEQLAIFKDREKNINRIKAVLTERSWANLITQYPMGASVFFFGILVSTAVIQLIIFGGAVSLIAALLGSIFDEKVFRILRPLLGLLIAFLLTWLINGPFAQVIISEGILVKRYRLHHEMFFLLFLLIYTAVHLVLGVFIALFRLFWVMLGTIATLNRLDQNIFPLFKRNDIGHRSFMSMVLMNHAFLSNADTGTKLSFAELIHRVQEVEDLNHDSPPPSGSSSPTSPNTNLAESSQDQSQRTPEKSNPEGKGDKQVVFYMREDFDDNEPDPDKLRLPII